MYIVLAIMIVFVTVTLNKIRVIKKLERMYPTFGNVSVKMVWRRSLSKDFLTMGTFDSVNRVISIAMFNNSKKIMDTYLHERRHSEQCFGSDMTLRGMYVSSVSILNFMNKQSMSAEASFDEYYNAPHEIDAREWASFFFINFQYYSLIYS